jgi:hypothetical protein
MINARMTSSYPTISYQKSTHNPEYSRIICGAVVNKGFQKLLLADPAQAIALGYCGEKFHLREDEMRHVSSIRATTLADFASQLLQVPEPAPIALSYASRK